MNEDSEKWKIGRFLVKGDRMKKKVDSELSLRELKSKDSEGPQRDIKEH